MMTSLKATSSFTSSHSSMMIKYERRYSSLSASSSEPSSSSSLLRRFTRSRHHRQKVFFASSSPTTSSPERRKQLLSPPHDISVPLPSAGKNKPPLSIERAISEYPWRGGLEPIENYAHPVQCETVFGAVPEEVKGGTLYRLGPGRCRLGSTKYAHWFDGDGCMHEVRFGKENGEVTMRSAMVETERYKAQET